ncbi:hypothetical protein P167DRAFT_580585 [Morchella conica CCBAS932]|uniref:Uncharacterized protein n=1 Tax=Morchella conica CCBAS932 TaxID=1392247 RepID=A0A3N4KAB1_9PEZI|nr:hypothetical protein P167DRAFT_580585 [Morchella conica CCBAS932]
MIGVIQICIGVFGLFASILGTIQYWKHCGRKTGLDEENTVRPETIQIPDEISSQSNLNDYQPMVKYYKISETREIQGSPPPYTLSIQKPAAAKLKPNLWSLHVLPIHNTLVLIIDLDERRKQSKNKGFQAIGT